MIRSSWTSFPNTVHSHTPRNHKIPWMYHTIQTGNNTVFLGQDTTQTPPVHLHSTESQVTGSRVTAAFDNTVRPDTPVNSDRPSFHTIPRQNNTHRGSGTDRSQLDRCRTWRPIETPARLIGSTFPQTMRTGPAGTLARTQSRHGNCPVRDRDRVHGGHRLSFPP